MQLAPRRQKPFPWHILVFLAPAVLIYTIFMIYPLVDSLRLSFFTQDARNVETVEAVRATDFLLGHDEWGAAWIANHRAKQAAAASA